MSTVPPAATRSMAFWMVRSGAPIVPAAESLPVAETTTVLVALEAGVMVGVAAHPARAIAASEARTAARMFEVIVDPIYERPASSKSLATRSGSTHAGSRLSGSYCW